MDLYRAQFGLHKKISTVVPATHEVSPASALAAASHMANHPFQSVSRTQLNKHAARMRQMARTLGGGGGTKRPFSDAMMPPAPVTLYAAPSADNRDGSSGFLGRLLRSMGQRVLPPSRGTTLTSNVEPRLEDREIMMELDHDVSQAVVFTGGRLLGLPSEELYQSPGLRKLVARNIQWFQQTPDWLKLLGLCAAKKLNGYILGSRGEGGEQQAMMMTAHEDNNHVTSTMLPLFPPPPPPPLVTEAQEEDDQRPPKTTRRRPTSSSSSLSQEQTSEDSPPKKRQKKQKKNTKEEAAVPEKKKSSKKKNRERGEKAVVVMEEEKIKSEPFSDDEPSFQGTIGSPLLTSSSSSSVPDAVSSVSIDD